MLYSADFRLDMFSQRHIKSERHHQWGLVSVRIAFSILRARFAPSTNFDHLCDRCLGNLPFAFVACHTGLLLLPLQTERAQSIGQKHLSRHFRIDRSAPAAIRL